MRNPKAEEFKIEAVAELAEELESHDEVLNEENGAGLSKRWGNTGRICSLTVECQIICGW